MICPRCHRDLPAEAWHRRPQRYCRGCWRAYTRPYKRRWERRHVRLRWPDGARQRVLILSPRSNRGRPRLPNASIHHLPPWLKDRLDIDLRRAMLGMEQHNDS